ncbi:hypothetical protein [Streptomyces sp. DW26H14]|uniref:hypothetical protein n=1 Tax=Streptomyces sp. DW26H14 TaxID=3435395 RepID=UPI00403D69F1
MSDSTGAQPGEGSSGAGHVQQVIETQQMRVDAAWRAYVDHIRACDICRAGVDCETAVELRVTWQKLLPRV